MTDSKGSTTKATKTKTFAEEVASLVKRAEKQQPHDRAVEAFARAMVARLSCARSDAERQQQASALAGAFKAYRAKHPEWSRAGTRAGIELASRDFARWAVPEAFVCVCRKRDADRARVAVDMLDAAEEAARQRAAAKIARELGWGTTERLAPIAAHVIEAAQALALLSQSPLRDDALETVRAAVLALQGQRGAELPPKDYVHRFLAGAYASGERANVEGVSFEPAARTLWHIVERRARRFRQDGDPRHVILEAKQLRSEILDTLGEADWQRLSIWHCAEALTAWVPQARRGKPGTRGCVAMLLENARPYPEVAHKTRVQIADVIDKARSRRGRARGQ